MNIFEKKWIMWVALFTLSPSGIYLLWRYRKKYNVNLKIILTIIFIMYFIYIIPDGRSLFFAESKISMLPTKSQVIMTPIPFNEPPTIDVTKQSTVTIKPVAVKKACIGATISDFKKKYGKSIHEPSYEFYRFDKHGILAMTSDNRVSHVTIDYRTINRTPDFEDALREAIIFLPPDAVFIEFDSSEEGRNYYYKSKQLEKDLPVFNGNILVMVHTSDDGIFSTLIAAGEKP